MPAASDPRPKITSRLTRMFSAPGSTACPRKLAAFTFVDIGCGKGRALLLAEEYPFRKIIGVEFSRRLAKIAAANAAKSARSASQWFTPTPANFNFPPEPLVVFLYNPFSGEFSAPS